MEENLKKILVNYNLIDVDVKYDLDKYIIVYGKKTYYLYKIDDIEKIDFIINLNLNDNRYYSIVDSINGEKVSNYEGKKYVLFRVSNSSFNVYDLFNSVCMRYKIKLNWYELWIEAEKYWESFYLKYMGKFDLIDESIDYYFSMLDLSIYYISKHKNYYGYAYIQHFVVNSEYFNPMNLKIDVFENDFSEYLKYLFFESGYSYDEVVKLINAHNNLNYDLVVSRLLFPNYYFDLVQKSFILDKVDDGLKGIINRIVEYQEYVSFIVSKINEVKS